MDPNIPVQPTPSKAPEIQTPLTQSIISPNPEQPTKIKSKLSKRILVTMVFVVLLLIVGTGDLLLQKLTLKPQSTITTITTQPTPISNPMANWKTYQNNELGFSIKHPIQYSVVTDEEIVSRDHPQIGIPYMFLKISSTESANNFVLIKASTDAFKTIEESFIALKNPMVYTKKISVGGLSAKRYSVNYNDPVIGKCQGKANGVVIEKGDADYILFTCNQNLETFNQMLSSFKFNDLTSQTVATPTSITDPTANWKTYSNKGYGFSFKFPQDYTVTEKIQKSIFNDFYNQPIDRYELTFSTGKLVDQVDSSKLADWSGFSIDVGPTGGKTISQYYAGQKGMGGPIIATSVNPDGNALEATTLSNVNGTYKVYRFGNYFYSVSPFQNGNTLPDGSDNIWKQIDLILSTIKLTQ